MRDSVCTARVKQAFDDFYDANCHLFPAGEAHGDVEGTLEQFGCFQKFEALFESQLRAFLAEQKVRAQHCQRAHGSEGCVVRIQAHRKLLSDVRSIPKK